jgi:hypothetical protein
MIHFVVAGAGSVAGYLLSIFFWQVTPWFLQIMRHVYYVYYYLYIEGRTNDNHLLLVSTHAYMMDA